MRNSKLCCIDLHLRRPSTMTFLHMRMRKARTHIDYCALCAGGLSEA